jgi:hypothetical protein
MRFRRQISPKSINLQPTNLQSTNFVVDQLAVERDLTNAMLVGLCENALDIDGDPGNPGCAEPRENDYGF